MAFSFKFWPVGDCNCCNNCNCDFCTGNFPKELLIGFSGTTYTLPRCCMDAFGDFTGQCPSPTNLCVSSNGTVTEEHCCLWAASFDAGTIYTGGACQPDMMPVTLTVTAKACILVDSVHSRSWPMVEVALLWIVDGGQCCANPGSTYGVGLYYRTGINESNWHDTYCCIPNSNDPTHEFQEPSRECSSWSGLVLQFVGAAENLVSNAYVLCGPNNADLITYNGNAGSGCDCSTVNPFCGAVPDFTSEQPPTVTVSAG